MRTLSMRRRWTGCCSIQINAVCGDILTPLLYRFESWPKTPLRDVVLGCSCHRSQVSTGEMLWEWWGFLAVSGQTWLNSQLWILLSLGNSYYHSPPGSSRAWSCKIILPFLDFFSPHKYTADTTEGDWIDLALEMKDQQLQCENRTCWRNSVAKENPLLALCRKVIMCC